MAELLLACYNMCMSAGVVLMAQTMRSRVNAKVPYLLAAPPECRIPLQTSRLTSSDGAKLE